MGYTAVRGGEQAVAAAAHLDFEQTQDALLSAEQVLRGLPYIVDQVMSEARIYGPELAARAIAQARGDVAEAVFLLRAYRSTLERVSTTPPLDTGNMRLVRRISSSFKDIPGGQVLGATRDYTPRLLGRSAPPAPAPAAAQEAQLPELTDDPEGRLPRVLDALRAEGLVDAPASDEDPGNPYDLTRQPLRFPAPRSGRLQALAGAETGAVSALAYSSLRGYGVHPTIAEFRVGYLPLLLQHPYAGTTVEAGEIHCTEVEMAERASTSKRGFRLGYGLTFGRNERKGISMAILDAAIEAGNARPDGPKGPPEDEEYILYHVDGLESTGFLEHLKLPHYVDFQSDLDLVRSRAQEQQR